MRKEAQDYRAFLLREIESGVGRASQGGGPAASAPSASSSAIKSKLENAISVMQEGLVEREAEVGGGLGCRLLPWVDAVISCMLGGLALYVCNRRELQYVECARLLEPSHMAWVAPLTCPANVVPHFQRLLL